MAGFKETIQFVKEMLRNDPIVSYKDKSALLSYARRSVKEKRLAGGNKMKPNLKQAAANAIQIITPSNTFHVDPATATAMLNVCERSAPKGRIYAFEKDKVIALVNEPVGTPHEGHKVYIKN